MSHIATVGVTMRTVVMSIERATIHSIIPTQLQYLILYALGWDEKKQKALSKEMHLSSINRFPLFDRSRAHMLFLVMYAEIAHATQTRR